ncbi:MAG: CtsR family transcriptional regulator [Clostridia bacterium]|nr:CtsR family transcriptional regulator [Clostridia bacterium]
MANISDVIERFLIEMMAEDNFVSISRNELANYFSCAPSQINYVLTTRFTPARGFVIESHRGGGGCINLVRLKADRHELLEELRNIPIREGLSQSKALQYLDRMISEKIVSEREAKIISSMIADKSLYAPAVAKDSLRAGIMSALATQLIKEKEGE